MAIRLSPEDEVAKDVLIFDITRILSFVYLQAWGKL